MSVLLHEAFSAAARGGQRCSICNTHGQPGAPVVTTGIVIDFEGEFEVCAGCVGEMARLIGWVPPEEHTALALSALTADGEAERLSAELVLKQQTVDALARELAQAGYAIAVYETPVVTEVDVEPDFDGAPSDG